MQVIFLHTIPHCMKKVTLTQLLVNEPLKSCANVAIEHEAEEEDGQLRCPFLLYCKIYGNGNGNLRADVVVVCQTKSSFIVSFCILAGLIRIKAILIYFLY